MLYGKVFPKKYNMTQPYNSGREKYYYNQLRLKPGKMATIENLLMLVFVSHANDVANNLSNFNMTHPQNSANQTWRFQVLVSEKPFFFQVLVSNLLKKLSLSTWFIWRLLTYFGFYSFEIDTKF